MSDTISLYQSDVLGYAVVTNDPKVSVQTPAKVCFSFTFYVHCSWALSSAPRQDEAREQTSPGSIKTVVEENEA